MYSTYPNLHTLPNRILKGDSVTSNFVTLRAQVLLFISSVGLLYESMSARQIDVVTIVITSPFAPSTNPNGRSSGSGLSLISTR